MFLEIELCSFQISDSSQIKKISLSHRFSKQIGVLGTDILITEGEGIKANQELDHICTTRCYGNKDKKKGAVYFLDSKNKTIDNVTTVLSKIHEISPSWLSSVSLCAITPKLENFINIPSVRGLKKMQYEAQYLYNSSVLGSSFSDFLRVLFSNTLQLEEWPLSKLKCLATHEITNLKDQMSSPRDGKTLELTDPYQFMKDHEERLINHIKRIARKRIFWGCSRDISNTDLAYKGTIAHILKDFFLIEIVDQIVQIAALDDL